MPEPTPDLLDPSGRTRRERLRDRRRSLSFLNRTTHWIITHATWWVSAFVLLYGAGAAFLGWRASYEVLVGLSAPGETRYPSYAYALCLADWLLVPAFIGAVAGYLVTGQIDARRRLSEAEVLERMRTPGDGHGADPPLRVRSLAELERDGDENTRRFVEKFVNGPHAGDQERAKDHWTRTVQHLADNVRELEELTPTQVALRTDQLAQSVAFDLAQLDRCWACSL
ncbi:DUF6313 family protein [Streptomyces sp. NPDC001642]|uniref:DUF6313 family protein n=1 Tax=Streptomyces sp. NPDC001642 TaxID=3154392 RepID=UPI0033348C39